MSDIETPDNQASDSSRGDVVQIRGHRPETIHDGNNSNASIDGARAERIDESPEKNDTKNRSRRTTSAAKRSDTKKCRSSIACKRCHASKIRCDVSKCGVPCTRCRERQLSDCELIVSRRGTYDRKEWLRKRREQQLTRQQFKNSVDKPVDNTPEPIMARSLAGANLSTLSNDHNESSIAAECNRSNDNRNADVDDWSTIFDYIGKTGKDMASYFGDPLALKRLLQSSSPEEEFDSSMSINEADERHAENTTFVDENQYGSPLKHPSHMSPIKLKFLENENCFQKPPQRLLDELIKAYFTTLHPVYPVINFGCFLSQYKEGRIPWLLLHSICLAACSHCSLSVLARIGFDTARNARTSYYRKAKSLFDFSYEKNKLVLLQSAMLLSFWGGRPNDYWNTFSWVSASVNLAETLGLHHGEIPNSSLFGDLSECNDSSFWRRIWWVLVIRDAFSAVLLGKPLRIDLSQSNVAPLTIDDFANIVRVDGSLTDSREGLQENICVSYLIEACKLSLILHQAKYGRASGLTGSTEILRSSLDIIRESSMPESFLITKGDTESENCAEISRAAISLLYRHILIYIYQPVFCLDSSSLDEVLIAATEISELGSSLVTRSMLARIPPDAYSAFFMALVTLFVNLQNILHSSNLTPEILANGQLIRSQINILEMVIHRAQDFWDHSDWILALCGKLKYKLERASHKLRDTGLAPATQSAVKVNSLGDQSLSPSSSDSSKQTDTSIYAALHSLFSFQDSTDNADDQSRSVLAPLSAIYSTELGNQSLFSGFISRADNSISSKTVNIVSGIF
ncbi:fungal-specific transcription factor domain-containing protein [Dipodascopsis uninucleata]